VNAHVTIPTELLELLRCPRCKGQLRLVERDRVALECAACQLRYQIRDGIPIMLIDEAEPL
jgi:uncharacterized protein YbaR (Trm112 family)